MSVEMFETGHSIKRRRTTKQVQDSPVKDLSFYSDMIIIPLPAKESYVEDNLKDYGQVLLRKTGMSILTLLDFLQLPLNHQENYLNSLKDQEIFDLLGIKIGYRSRQELVASSLSALTKKTFFILNVPKIFPTNIEIIGYGTVTNYVTYNCQTATKSFLSGFSVEDFNSLEFVLKTFV